MPLKMSVIMAVAAALIGAAASAQEPQSPAPTPEQIKAGAELFAVNCSPCHGPRMEGAESAFDLRKFPPGERTRFLNSVTRGKNQMPPWGDFFKPEQLDQLWAYISHGEKN